MSPQETYRQFARYYDLYVGQFDADLAMYRDFCQAQDRILEIGCGTGRVLRHLLSHDFLVTGIDISDDMLRIAEQRLAEFQRSGRLQLKNHNFMDTPLPEKYTKILITFYTFNYIFDTPGIFLKHMTSSMERGASLLIDLFEPKTTHAPHLENVWQERTFPSDGRTLIVKDRRHFSARVEERTQIFLDGEEELQITTRRRYYTPAEMRDLLTKVGLTNIRFSDAYDAQRFTGDIASLHPETHYLVLASW